MRRRRVDEGRISRQAVDHEALAVDRNIGDFGPVGHEDPSGHWIPGVFHGDRRSGSKHDLSDELYGLLRPVGDEHVIWLAVNRSTEADVVGDCFT
jgi:hypothetical protein